VSGTRDAPLVVLLHGFLGTAADLAPFARSLGVDASFHFPEGPVDLASRGLRGRAWWAVDGDARDEALRHGPRDLSTFHPEGLDQARAFLEERLDELARLEGDRPVVLGGFSQGAMLCCDVALRTARPLAGLAFFSGSRITASLWRPLYAARRGQRTFMSHGRNDDDLSFLTADAFRSELEEAGWDLTWCPFDGGHEIPLVAWRSFKRWLTHPV